MLDNAPVFRASLKVTLDILLAVACCAVIFIIMRITAIPLILSLVELTEIQTHAVKGLVNLLSFSLGYWLFARFYEKRKAVELVFSVRDMVFGTLLGAAIISVTTLPLFTFGYYQVVANQSFDEMFFAIIGLTTQAIFGAILFTGIIYRLIEQRIGTKYSLLSLSVALGTLNILVDGPDLVVLLSSTLINALWFSIYILSRNLWVVGLANGAWLSAVFATGILDEHWRASAPIVSQYNGPVLITGGEFGPEHSIITIVVVTLCVFLLLRAAKAKELLLA